MGTLVRILLTFWLRPTAAEPLALFRILLGATLLASALGTIWPRLDRDFGPEGEIPGSALGQWPERTHRFSLFLLPGVAADDLAQARLFFAAWVTALGCLTVGLATRVSAVLAWLLTLSFHTRLDWILNGGDAILRLGLFYLLLAPCGRVWSLDRWLIGRWGWRGHWAASSVAARWRRALAERMGWKPPGPNDVPAWSLRLAQIQLVLIYFCAGIIKLGSGYPTDGPDIVTAGRGGDFQTVLRGIGHAVAGQDWLNGEAVYWVLNDVTVNRFPYFSWPVPLVVCRLLSWVTLIFEVGFPFLVLSRRLRPWLLVGGVCFHVGILVHMEIGWFSLAMLCWYPLLLSGGQARRIVGIEASVAA